MDFDIQSLTQIANIAGQAFNTTERGVSLVRSIQGMFEKSEAASDPDIKLAVADLASQIGDAALANAKLKFQIAEMQQAALKANKFEAEIERYALEDTGTGFFIYKLKNADANGEPMHCICPTCVENGQKSILQGKGTLRCHSCKAEFFVSWNNGFL